MIFSMKKIIQFSSEANADLSHVTSEYVGVWSPSG